MKTNIDYILQLEDQNMLQVVYKSDVNRFLYLSDHDYKMTKAQKAFFDNSFKIDMIHATRDSRTITYWLNKDDPNKAILSAIKVKNDLYKKA